MKKGEKGKHLHIHKREELVEKAMENTFPVSDPSVTGSIARVVDKDKDADAHQDKRTHGGKHQQQSAGTAAPALPSTYGPFFRG